MAELKKMELTSASGASINLEALCQICPSAFTEVRDEKTGQIERKINFTTLRELLGDNAYEGADEEYGFNWVGKRAAQQEAGRPINKTLRLCPNESEDWESTQNLYIEGDNLDVLKLLQKSYLGAIKMIYIDPPYNTGNDFVYRDDFAMKADDYDLEAGNVDELGNRFRKNTDANARFHSDWCSMIYERLLIARTLLKSNGVIFISIDDHEVDNLRKISDEVFGESNFVTQFVWEKKKKPSFLNANIGVKVEYILCYARNRFELGALSIDTTEEGKKYPLNNAGNSLATLSFPPHTVKFNLPDGIVRKQDMSEGKIITELLDDFEIKGGTNETSFRLYGEWRYSQEKLNEIIANQETLVISKIPFRPNHVKAGGEIKKMHNLLSIANYSIATNEDATAEQVELFGNSYFEYAKPSNLIALLIKAATYSDSDTIILDFFSGSATTAHSVIKLNAEDKSNRKFIMVQLPEETEIDSDARNAGFSNICEIGKERIRRAGKKIKAEHPEATNLDTGFRVFKLADSNMEDVYFAPKEIQQQDLFALVNNVKEGRGDLDLLFGCMLDWGVQLSLPLAKKQVADKTIHIVNDGDLVACFDDGINEEVINAIADLDPLRVVFKDSGFASAPLKINLFEMFKQRCGWSEENVADRVRII